MNASESDDALAKAFASIASVGERVGRGTLGAYELQVFLKRNFGRSPHLKEMMDAADASEDGARLHPPRRPTLAPHKRHTSTYAAVLLPYNDHASPEAQRASECLTLCSDPKIPAGYESRRRD